MSCPIKGWHCLSLPLEQDMLMVQLFISKNEELALLLLMLY